MVEQGIPCIFEGCDGRALPLKKDGRFIQHRKVLINVPEEIAIPRCGKCQRDLITKDVERMLTGVLENEYQRHAHIIKPIFAKNRKIQ